ncbi:MAG: hypothetical protein JW829_09950 [Pirellulales bacterium]|nr:hypothetical protein [Pirellulales bacterium]
MGKVDRDRIQWKLTERWDAFLDECHGACLLKQADLARIVADSLFHFDSDRYLLTDFVVMPNHVHLMASFFDEEAIFSISIESCIEYGIKDDNLA